MRTMIPCARRIYFILSSPHTNLFFFWSKFSTNSWHEFEQKEDISTLIYRGETFLVNGKAKNGNVFMAQLLKGNEVSINAPDDETIFIRREQWPDFFKFYIIYFLLKHHFTNLGNLQKQ